MTTVKTAGTVLKPFQTEAVENATAILSRCLRNLAEVRATITYEQSRAVIVGDLGAVLFEAPTGTGKTLMAGTVAENLSLLYGEIAAPPILWFWFAPFAGLVDQASRVIRSEFPALRIKNPSLDRNPGDLHSGDVYVTTWASVAVANEASRKARSGSEELPSIDALVLVARSRGFAIGAVIDEAHHSFRGQSQAFAFYREVLRPEVTLLATATPRDKDVDAFCKAAGVSNLRRITVSRQQAVAEHLIKQGVKVAVFKVSDNVAGLIDFKRTALRQGVAGHRKLHELLASHGSKVVPLLLVQVESEDDAVAMSSVEQATAWLKELGFRSEGDSEVVRSHTAKEPDPYFSAIAADETVEVLIFKMAAAIGFDAPRAFTLVSFRPSRDEDFGVQIVGRIMRVDRRLQAARDLPEALNYGYVFLSDNSGQTGLLSAASRINAVRNELASVASSVAVVTIGEQEAAAQLTQHGQIRCILDEGHRGLNVSADGADEELYTVPEQGQVNADGSRSIANEENLQQVLSQEWDLTPQTAIPAAPDGRTSPPPRESACFSYPLRSEFAVPARFSRAVFSPNGEDILRGIVARFRFDEAALLVAQQSAAKIIMEEVEIFAGRRDRPEEIRAELAQREIDAKAQLTLLRADEYEAVDVQELYRALQAQLKKVAEQHGLDVFDTPEKLRAGLHKILALRPEQLKNAVSETIARHIASEPVEPLPQTLQSFAPLDPARLNLYGVFPEDLNSWERPFAEVLDNDLSGTVLWWHRNPVRKPWSVSMPLPGQNDFYPDFVVGVKSRNRGQGILLVETKREINDERRNALIKAQAVHPEYGKVMMLYWVAGRQWQVVEYDPATDKNRLDRVLRMELLAVY